MAKVRQDSTLHDPASPTLLAQTQVEIFHHKGKNFIKWRKSAPNMLSRPRPRPPRIIKLAPKVPQDSTLHDPPSPTILAQTQSELFPHKGKNYINGENPRRKSSRARARDHPELPNLRQKFRKTLSYMSYIDRFCARARQMTIWGFPRDFTPLPQKGGVSAPYIYYSQSF